MEKLRRLIQIARDDGAFEACNQSFRFGVNQLPDFIWRPFVIYGLLQDGRSFQDIEYLLENNRDRHDALVGPDRLYSSAIYPKPQTRAQHYYRYVFAANQAADRDASSVLDIAAGLSYGTHIFKTKLGSELEYIAGDISVDALAYGQKYYSPDNSIQADGQNLPLDANSVDIVVSFETMEHIPNVEEYLKELNRVISPNGDLFFSVPNDEDLDSKEEHNVKEYPHMHVFDYEKFRDTLNRYFSERNLTVYAQEYPLDVKNPMEVENLPPGFSEVNEQQEIADQSTLLAHIK
ncbi:class I SAM-dependent methyltransferase [Halobacteria archaeon AArc-curdl1]|uniref:Class I SAM-dependent methyltransferase n=1 Tax=Natronosalvus hydrolyticus TaxID=2979988 RepID=A0AAP2ZBW3_9EURY|nr:class I SAM-dependent methyltransferase [Halobacteria archaeon AArc-curdl1]